MGDARLELVDELKAATAGLPIAWALPPLGFRRWLRRPPVAATGAVSPASSAAGRRRRVRDPLSDGPHMPAMEGFRLNDECVPPNVKAGVRLRRRVDGRRRRRFRGENGGRTGRRGDSKIRSSPRHNSPAGPLQGIFECFIVCLPPQIDSVPTMPRAQPFGLLDGQIACFEAGGRVSGAPTVTPIGNSALMNPLFGSVLLRYQSSMDL